LLGWKHSLFIINKGESEPKKKDAQYQLWLTSESSKADLPTLCLEDKGVKYFRQVFETSSKLEQRIWAGKS
jgi:hypothetical protein